METEGSSGNPEKPRGRPYISGQSGNLAGRPPGSRNRVTVAAEQLLDGEAENLTRKAIELALDGNLAALRLCLDRILPARRDRPLQLDLPKLQSLEDAEEATTRIVAAVSAGEIGISDATELAKLVELYVRAREARVKEIDAEIRHSQEEEDRRDAKNGGFRFRR